MAQMSPFQLFGMKPAFMIEMCIRDRAMDEDIDATQCRGDGSCLGGAACLTHHLWEDLNRTTRKFLEGVTLAGMVEAHAARHGKQVVSAVIPVRKHA